MGHCFGESLAEIPEKGFGDLIPPGGGRRGRRPAAEELEPFSLKKRSKVWFSQDGGVELPV
jgi:hypothetical protein